MNRPTVGTTVTVVVRNLVRHRPVYIPMYDSYTPESPETITYIGVVVTPDKWLKPNEFNLTTGLSHFPIRTINLNNVISINKSTESSKLGTDNEGPEEPSKLEHKQVRGSKGDMYTVMLKNGVAETCTCPAFQYRGGRCKHLVVAMGAAPAAEKDLKPRKAKAVRTAARKAAKPKQRKATKLERAKELYRNSKGGRKSTINLFVTELDMTPAGAQTYYYLVRK